MNNLEVKLEELNKYVELISNEETTLEEGILAYEKATKLSKECFGLLTDASGKIKELTKEMENTLKEIEDFE